VSENIPNPFPSHTRFSYALAHASDVETTVYDVRGASVRRLDSGWHERGIRELTWDGADDHGVAAPSGVYYVRVRTAAGTVSRKITLLR